VRLFVAVTPPQEAVEELRAATAAVRPARPDLRWTRPEQWHLTLVFLGEVDERARADLGVRLGRAAGRHPPLQLAVQGAGRFGDRVLWMRVTGDVTGLKRLAASVQAAARRARLPVEERPYRPHLTLARGREGVDLRPVVEALAGFGGSTWIATQLHLVRSDLGAGEGGTSRHEVIATWSLGRPPATPGTRASS
jgi:RNA 2',3'-cyclic 3'-phosphodiesterase